MSTRKSEKSSAAKPKWERTPRELAALQKAKIERAEGVPRLNVSKFENGLRIIAEHPDQAAGAALIMEAIATNDMDFLGGFLAQLANSGGGEIDEKRLNFMLAVVKGIKPRDQLEAMLAAQMAAVHTATMKFSTSLADADCLDHRDSAERTFNKLTRTYVTQMEALKRYRAGEQAVTVQQVNVSEGGQAIVGNVTNGQRDVVPNGIPSQPLAIAHDETLPMQIIESSEAALVPVPRNSKKK